MNNLYQHSIEILTSYQSPSGAFIASPTFPEYEYCWFRDSSFIAYALDLAGLHEKSHRFHQWAVETICRYEQVVEWAVGKNARKLPLQNSEVLHTRYKVNGDIGNDAWPNFQLDGFGTWLWALGEHIYRAKVGVLPPSWAHAVKILTRYLGHLWYHPNFDCWEEYGDKIHTYTLGSIYAGLRAMEPYLDEEISVGEITTSIKNFIRTKCVCHDHLIKFIGTDTIDASLLALSTPYGLFRPDDPIMTNTVRLIENMLRVDGGGVHRYAEDTYYGGGEWILLAAWLGWYYSELGMYPKARKILTWVENQADEVGDLPEQVPHHLIDPYYLETWIQSRGQIACPLLWSHAKYLILSHALNI